jgi:uncharacterized protein YdcH (DUF465 family)
VWSWRNPLIKAGAVVVPAAALGYGAAAVASGGLEDALITATTALVFGAFFGGLVKLWLDDFQREREARQEQVRFVTAVLADLKSVYDRVERARILIEAHRSASTYADEMGELIDGEVQLRNVIRALDQGTSGILEEHLDDVRQAVRSMEGYLKSLTAEFRDEYKEIADKQRIYDAHFDRLLDDRDREDWSALRAPASEAWADIEELPKLREFREYSDARPYSEGYGLYFAGALSLATWILRAELKRLRREPRSVLPAELDDVRARLVA